MNQNLVTVSAMAAALVLLGAVSAGAARAATEFKGTAIVLDGDSIEIRGQRINLYGIDAPEPGQSCERLGASYPCGREATRALARGIGQDVVTCRQKHLNQRRQPVAVCKAGGVDISAWMVRQGWAVPHPKFGTAYKDEADAARKYRRGVWGGGFTLPWVWREQH
jgi:endonuclease YncB( thermonuclease family)